MAVADDETAAGVSVGDRVLSLMLPQRGEGVEQELSRVRPQQTLDGHVMRML